MAGLLLRLTAVSVCGCKLKFSTSPKKCETLSKANVAHVLAAGLGSKPDGLPSGSFHHLCNNKQRDSRRVTFCNLASGTALPGASTVKAPWSKRSNPDTSSSPQPPWQQSSDGPCLSNPKQGWDAHRGHGGQVRWVVRVWHFTTKRVVSHSLSLSISLHRHAGASYPQKRQLQCWGKTIKAPL